jgi:3-deoxy-manno-octulosonate cytidylyltransferase (CMP-KDO synthetase)
MKILAIIPARYGSTRFPGKPLIDIKGKSMIQRVYEQAMQVFDYLYVATDDYRIEKHIKDLGYKVVMTSSSHQSGTDRCAEALNIIEEKENTTFKIVVNIQGDEPFIMPEQLQKLLTPFNNPLTEIATLIKRIENYNDLIDPNKPKVVINKNGQAIYFSRSIIPYIRNAEQSEWLSNCVFYKHIGLYAYRSDILREITKLDQGILEKAESLEQLRWIENGYIIMTTETQYETISIDTPEDMYKIDFL